MSWIKGMVGLILSVLSCDVARAQVTERASVATGGTQGNYHSDYATLSVGGRYVAFSSGSSNLVPGDTNGWWDVFLRDRELATTEQISIATDGTPGNRNSWLSSITADGRFVAFESNSTNLVPGASLGVGIYVRDREAGTTEIVSMGIGGVPADGDSGCARLSADGRCVAFRSWASNLVAGDTNVVPDVFVYDRQTGTTERISVATDGTQANDWSAGSYYGLAISADGRFVAFESMASTLVPNDTNGTVDVFVRDRSTGTTERVSVGPGGAQANADSEATAISADGRYVAFKSRASLAPEDTNGWSDVYVRDRLTGTTELVSRNGSGLAGNQNSDFPSLSADGRYVAFESRASDLVAGDANGFLDVFVRDRALGTTELVSLSTSGQEGNRDYGGFNAVATLSPEGRYVAYGSPATTLVAGDTNDAMDVFVRDRDATMFASLCEPGVESVIPCPCGNPPSGPDRGCNNFAPAGGTGGAALGGSGTPSIGADTVSIQVSNTLKQIHVLFVGTSLAANVRTGAGVRCVDRGTNGIGQGFLKRIAKRTPRDGPPSTVAFTGIRAASVAKGAPPSAGQTYYYYAAYRNAAANGAPGCPGLSFGFNATNAGAVTWYP